MESARSETFSTHPRRVSHRRHRRSSLVFHPGPHVTLSTDQISPITNAHHDHRLHRMRRTRLVTAFLLDSRQSTLLDLRLQLGIVPQRSGHPTSSFRRLGLRGRLGRQRWTQGGSRRVHHRRGDRSVHGCQWGHDFGNEGSILAKGDQVARWLRCGKGITFGTGDQWQCWLQSRASSLTKGIKWQCWLQFGKKRGSIWALTHAGKA